MSTLSSCRPYIFLSTTEFHLYSDNDLSRQSYRTFGAIMNILHNYWHECPYDCNHCNIDLQCHQNSETIHWCHDLQLSVHVVIHSLCLSLSSYAILAACLCFKKWRPWVYRKSLTSFFLKEKKMIEHFDQNSDVNKHV